MFELLGVGDQPDTRAGACMVNGLMGTSNCMHTMRPGAHMYLQATATLVIPMSSCAFVQVPIFLLQLALHMWLFPARVNYQPILHMPMP
jgi:hypothetical protein